MKVVATSKGYYGGAIREKGEEFDIGANEKLGSWMAPVEPIEVKADKPKPSKKETPKVAEPEPAADEVM